MPRRRHDLSLKLRDRTLRHPVRQFSDLVVGADGLAILKFWSAALKYERRISCV
jgi:hypothetical protein